MFCIFSSVRYSNPKLMHVGHQYMAQTFDPKQFFVNKAAGALVGVGVGICIVG